MAMNRNSDAEYTHWRHEETKIIDGRLVRFHDVCVHEIKMGDVDDPDLFVADPIWRWQQTEAGKFIMEHAIEQPYWTKHMDHNMWGHKYRIMARLSDKDEIFWQLKWGNNK